MTNINLNSLRKGPDSNGRFGIHGGRFVAETLMPLVLNVEKSYEEALKDEVFLNELDMYRKTLGERFKACDMLIEYAKSNKTFY